MKLITSPAVLERLFFDIQVNVLVEGSPLGIAILEEAAKLSKNFSKGELAKKINRNKVHIKDLSNYFHNIVSPEVYPVYMKHAENFYKSCGYTY